MNEANDKPGLLKQLAIPLTALVAIICCLAGPLLIAGIGFVAIGVSIGWVTAGLAVAAICFVLVRRTQRRC